MELIVAALTVMGLILVAARFLLRDEAGQLVLPRIVDDSIGMWLLRRLTGRPLGDRLASGRSAPGRPREARSFNAAMAARLGIVRASDVVPPRPPAAGAWVVADFRVDDAFGPDPAALWRTVLRRQGGHVAWMANYPDEPSQN